MMRFFLHTVLCGAWLLAAAPAVAQSALETLTAAAKLSERGDHDAAVQKIGEAFRSGAMDNATAARAFLLRAEAYEKLGKPALALSDYTSAVYMQGLSTRERPRAVDGRKRTLALLGVTDDADGAKPLGDQASESAPKSSGGFLSGLFGGSSTSAEAEKPANSWAQGTRVAPGPAAAQPARPVAAAPIVAAPAAADASDTRQFTIVLASVSTEESAAAEARRLATRLSEELAGVTPEVARFERSDGPVFRVVAGPYQGAARSREICESMKLKKVSCMVISR
ncbi:MAG: SPOR domain-containing protein [Hyphomicrobiales bacterium]|nr:SPOR domain-containing protein [Hyphomicrobiales bacterium]